MTNQIQILDQQTIDKIAAGEVIERPASIVKELVENAIDAGATAVTVEIRDGGISFIRITDNGTGIRSNQVPLAFLRHATSKIRKVEDLLGVSSLGFRGEALSSIAAVCQVELITKTGDQLTGVRYLIEGGKEKSLEEIGAPNGTTFLVRNLFYNTPARKKFLKTPQTEAGYISDLMERIALSHPEISFQFINHNQTRMHTSGNHNLKDIIYHVYGRDIAANLLEVRNETDMVKITGYIGKPVISRGNRNYENYFVNGRYIKSNILSKAIEDAYDTFMMKHKYPFTALHFNIDGGLLDINVHPTKMELRFSDNETMYQLVYDTVREALTHKEMIPRVSVSDQKEERAEKVRQQKEEKKYLTGKTIPEPFEVRRREADSIKRTTIESLPQEVRETASYGSEPEAGKQEKPVPEQLSLFEDKLLSGENVKEHRIIGQLFDTYWLVEFRDQLFIIDQHAAHEKVLYERTMKTLKDRSYTSQNLNPPVILSLSLGEEALLKKYINHFTQIGFEIEEFGGKEYALRAVPDNLFGISQEGLFLEMLDSLGGGQEETIKAESIHEKIASMSCKAAVKGNHRMSVAEIHALIDELLTLDNPYHCPHGRPTIISMSKYDMERKFKRIV